MNIEKKEKMSKKRALCVLDISEKDPPIGIIKKQYRMLALKFHPDKNKDTNACEKFQEINEAYQFFDKKNPIYKMDDSNESYEDVQKTSNYHSTLFFFLNNIFTYNTDNRALFEIIRKLVTICEEKSLHLLVNINKSLVIKVYEMMQKYRDVLHFSDVFIEKVAEIVNNNDVETDEHIILHPFLDDLFNNSVYKLVLNNDHYFVPLWHHELVYDYSDRELIVSCIPILPENVTIDEKNNIHVILRFSIMYLWGETDIVFYLGNQKFSFPKKQLYLQEKQTYILENQGISSINAIDIYDINKKSDIYVKVEIDNDDI